MRTHPDDVVLITCNDLHLTDVPPASRVDNYVDEVFGLLDQIQQLALKVQASAVCIAGDIFHHKERPMGMPLLFRLYEWCDTLHTAGIPVLAIPGNHDLRYNKLSTLDDQPLGLMFRVGAMRNVSAYPAVVGPHTIIWGAPFPQALTLEGWTAARQALTPALCPVVAHPEARLVMLGHCFASRPGGNCFTETILRYEDILAACPAAVYVFGHDHTNGGVTHLGGATFINLGAISRGTIGMDDLHRDLTVGLVTLHASRDGEAGAIVTRQVRLKAQPVATLFNLQAKAAKDEERAKLEAYVASLQDTLASLDATTPIEAHLGTLHLADDVRARMEAYITSVEQAR